MYSLIAMYYVLCVLFIFFYILYTPSSVIILYVIWHCENNTFLFSRRKKNVYRQTTNGVFERFLFYVFPPTDPDNPSLPGVRS